MALPESETSVGDLFGLEVDGVFSSTISEVAGLKMERDVVELKEHGPDGAVNVRQLPGRWKSPELTLTRGLTADASFANWVKEPPPGQAADVGSSGAVTVVDQAGVVITKYLFTQAWPKSLEIITTRDVGDVPTLSERLVLVCERIEPA